MAKQTFSIGQVLEAADMTQLQANDYNWTVSTKTDNYTLVAGDAGTRVVMNASTAKTITVDTSIFTAGDTVWIHNINTGTCTVTAGTATVNTAGSLALAQWEGGALYFTSASSAIFFRGGGANYGVATGGTDLGVVNVGGINYNILQFTGNGTLTVTKAGLFDFAFCSGGGGGGGGQTSGTTGGGGGGGGGWITGTVYLTATETITIGAGGAGGINYAFGKRGASSMLGSKVVLPGGGGGQSNLTIGTTDGVTGGGGFGTIDGLGILFNTTFGFAGSTGTSSGGGGGGGGSTATGGASSATVGGAGGAGTQVNTFIGGSSLFKSGGGGGGAQTTGGAGGSGVGGNGGGGNNVAGSSASANTGGGGGAGSGNSGGTVPSVGSGGSGICFIRI